MAGDETDDWGEQFQVIFDDLLAKWQQHCRETAEEEGLPDLEGPRRAESFPPWAIAQIAANAADIRRLEKSVDGWLEASQSTRELVDRLVRERIE